MDSARPILVAGKTGQLARCLADLGEQNQIPIVAVERPALDIEDVESIDRIMAAVMPRAVVNAAAYTAVDKAESEPECVFAVNRDGAARLAAAAARYQIPYIHISTDYVFDGRKSSPYREDDLPSPLSVYGRSKLEGELAVQQAHPAALVLRTSWMYSSYGQNFVRTMLRLAATRDKVRVVNDQNGSPTAARDVARAILDIVSQIVEMDKQSSGGIYHLAATGDTTWYDFAAAIFDGWAKRGWRVPLLEPITTADYPTPAQRPANSRLDCTKIAQTFGIRLPLWSESLEVCLSELAVVHTEEN